MATASGSDFIDTLERIFETEGSAEYLGEDVSMAEHMIQTAMNAEKAGASDTMIAAALIHDIGHFAHAQPDPDDWNRNHSEAGSNFLKDHFGPEVCEPVRLHVNAKRYLCAVEPSYFDLLSNASVHTLELQGGPMSPEQCAEFETNDWHKDAVQLRRWEEAGKQEGVVTPKFAHFKPVLERVLGV